MDESGKTGKVLYKPSSLSLDHQLYVKNIYCTNGRETMGHYSQQVPPNIWHMKVLESWVREPCVLVG